MTDEFYMNLALNEAWKYQLLTFPNPAVGCVILDKSGRILSVAAHEKAGCAHAELNAVFKALLNSPKFVAKFEKWLENLGFKESKKDAKFDKFEEFENFGDFKEINATRLYDFILQNHGGFLAGGAAFVTLEPCAHFGRTPPCAFLLKELKFEKVVIGSSEFGAAQSGGADLLKNAEIAVKMGVLKEKCDELLEPFKAWSSGQFSFFKIALSANGVAGGGMISSGLSRAHAHKIRALSDFLVIGGNTVRTDRPRLDSRLAAGTRLDLESNSSSNLSPNLSKINQIDSKIFVNLSNLSSAKNPNILIFSNSRFFDAKIPLFSVPGRRVFIKNNLEILKNARFVMIEGGENALKNIKKTFPTTKWLLIYRSNEFRDAAGVRLNLSFKLIFRSEFGDGGELLWCRIS